MQSRNGTALLFCQNLLYWLVKCEFATSWRGPAIQLLRARDHIDSTYIVSNNVALCRRLAKFVWSRMVPSCFIRKHAFFRSFCLCAESTQNTDCKDCHWQYDAEHFFIHNIKYLIVVYSVTGFRPSPVPAGSSS